MADPRRRLPANAPGDFFVDDTCIDCDLCRQIAPETFRAEGDVSVVSRQPAAAPELRRAEMALVTCPTASIGTLERHDLAAAIAAFPEPVEGEVFFCGYASEKSFGGSSYLIRRPEGNVLVDSPRFTEPLVRRIEAMGGVALMLLSHADDVADHAKFHERFGAARVMHEADAAFEAEHPLAGREPLRLAPDLLAIPTPGHTAGHVAYLYRDRFLFTGDHLWGEPETSRLGASRRYCWHSWSEQRRSMERLRDVEFEWVLPGHGSRLHLPGPEMRRALDALIARM
jgi:glyoxylase-like metal-dependent hydrolase (beta-lactamase superfamily II)/ferredoxin